MRWALDAWARWRARTKRRYIRARYLGYVMEQITHVRYPEIRLAGRSFTTGSAEWGEVILGGTSMAAVLVVAYWFG